MEKLYHVEYSSNNSGGGWWLGDEDWLKLEKAGWLVHWSIDQKPFFGTEREERWLGALARSACKKFSASSAEEAEELAAKDFQSVTLQDPEEEGCSCCGQPHNFYSSESYCSSSSKCLNKEDEDGDV